MYIGIRILYLWNVFQASYNNTYQRTQKLVRNPIVKLFESYGQSLRAQVKSNNRYTHVYAHKHCIYTADEIRENIEDVVSRLKPWCVCHSACIY